MSLAYGCDFRPGITITEYATIDVTRAINKGGPVADGAIIQPLFWGDFWQANNAKVLEIVQAISDILASPYLSELEDYGIHSVSVGTPTIVMRPGPPSPTYSTGDLSSMVWGLIDDDKYGEGDHSLFMVFAPPGTLSDDGVPGAHAALPDTDYLEDAGDILTLQGLDLARVAWINFGSIDTITEVFTHELVEALVDPEPGWNTGWVTDSTALGSDNEIADACILQIGMAGGHAVAAYFSRRLGKCVVPSEILPRSLSLSVATDYAGRVLPWQQGSTTVQHPSRCYSGTYSWTLWEGVGRATITADVSTFADPEIQWVINDVPMPPGAYQIDIQANVMVGADPLSTLTSLPPQVATLTCTVPDKGTLTIENSRQGQCNIDVRCSVQEQDLGLLCVGKCVEDISCALTGQVRVMDERWQADRAQCEHLQRELGRHILEQDVIPRIPEGDPPPPWVGRVILGVEQSVAADMQYLAMLAQFVERADPQLADALRHEAALTSGSAFAAMIPTAASGP